ncbi:hypothetical protein CYMTET_37900 [Cymbomonas tetramitiformis]|uniref:Endonuclease/exonuclease/phosphatase domain-containing protein n=1 Tax=Cymbomonas tetramitiformis TaxID=36881 RepID=A0AAE0CEK9_9CHLO|nr:hypothetical protein CYMTET_37900 [Cymbomonas tetramitiformis]
MVAAWHGWTKSPEESTWPRAAHQAAGGTGKVNNTRVAKQHKIAMQLATQREEQTDHSANAPRGSGRFPGKRAVLGPLQQVSGKENTPNRPTQQQHAKTRTVLGSWGNTNRGPEDNSNPKDEENGAPPPKDGKTGRLSLMTWNIRGSDHAYFDLARCCEKHQPDVLVLTETKAAGPMGPRKLQGLGYSAWHSAPCHGAPRRGADGASQGGPRP